MSAGTGVMWVLGGDDVGAGWRCGCRGVMMWVPGWPRARAGSAAVRWGCCRGEERWCCLSRAGHESFVLPKRGAGRYPGNSGQPWQGQGTPRGCQERAGPQWPLARRRKRRRRRRHRSQPAAHQPSFTANSSTQAPMGFPPISSKMQLSPSKSG